MDHIDTVLAHAGCSPGRPSRDVVAPIHLSTTYVREEDGAYPSGYVYTRSGNPTRDQLESTLAQLEGGVDCCCFASGMAAAAAVLNTLGPGQHVLYPTDVYHGFRSLIEGIARDWKIDSTSVEMTNADQVSASAKANTSLIWVETPSNPLLRVTPIKAISSIAKKLGATLVVDGTWATPLLQRPLDLGADLVVHALTKYLAGHSDVLGGAIVAREADARTSRIRKIQVEAGAVLDPFSSWLTMRGLRTLRVRLERQCETARLLAESLDSHPAVSVVHYPSLPHHPGHELAKDQMTDFGAMLSFEVLGTAASAQRIAAETRVFAQATSLGGTESLIEHRASVEGAMSSAPATLLRLSVGLEHPADLLSDLEQAIGQNS
jgi:cystathionine gamma-synthase